MRTSYWPLLLFPLFLAGQAGCPTEETDADGDGYTLEGGDCDDNDGSINPGAAEICGDALDNDCDGLIDESCVSSGFAVSRRVSELMIFGVDNGRADPPEFGEEVAWTSLEPFEASIVGELEYVRASSEQRSYVGAQSIYAEGFARASAQDDYGYGQGESESFNSFETYFDLLEPSQVDLNGELSLSQANDGGSVWGGVMLIKEGAEPIFEASATRADAIPLHYSGVLEPGAYRLQVEASGAVGISGGGDAYPGARVEYVLELSTR